MTVEFTHGNGRFKAIAHLDGRRLIKYQLFVRNGGWSEMRNIPDSVKSKCKSLIDKEIRKKFG